MAPSDREWRVSLDAWVLQDGNYTDFAVGERRRFALELGYRRDRRLRRDPAAAPPYCRFAGHGAWYDAAGRVVRVSSDPAAGRDAFVVDVGVLAFSHSLVFDGQEAPALGDAWSGRIRLGVDPLFYQDELVRLPGMPALAYDWRITRIELDATQIVEVEHGHPLYPGRDRGPQRVRDPERETWRPVERTHAWDDGGRAYRLTCQLEDDRPAPAETDR